MDVGTAGIRTKRTNDRQPQKHVPFSFLASVDPVLSSHVTGTNEATKSHRTLLELATSASVRPSGAAAQIASQNGTNGWRNAYFPFWLAGAATVKQRRAFSSRN